MKPSSSTAATPPSDTIHRRPIRLLLVDDHPVMRAGLANLLAMSGDFAIVGQADDGTTDPVTPRRSRPALATAALVGVAVVGDRVGAVVGTAVVGTGVGAAAQAQSV
jgi:hypothetical protein